MNHFSFVLVMAFAAVSHAGLYRSIVTDFGDHWTYGPHREKFVDDEWVEITDPDDFPRTCSDTALIPGGKAISIIARYDVIDIQVLLTNSGDVIAETSVDDEPGIKLSGEPKGGTGGYYRAKQGPAGYGNIEVYCPMSGTGDFQILDGGCGVLIDYAISCYAGDFQLTKGMLEFRKRVCTSGKFNAGHDGGSDDAYLMVKKATSGPANEFLFGADCGCQ